MLCYLGTGPRRYEENPIKAYHRPYWEFQAVISGRIAMVGEEGPDLLRKHHLWLSAPDHMHGWTGEKGKEAEVAVFHFLAIPEPLSLRIPQKGHLEIPLKKGQEQRLKELAGLVDEYWQRPRPEMLLRHEHILLELSLLVYEAMAQGSDATGESDVSRQRVQKAMDWFAGNMESNPALVQVASAAGSSVSHLRRHFHDVMQASPKKIFDQLRFQRATQLMADPGTKLSTVSDACGFESPSAFSRAFKTKFGCSPDTWRG
jgi:AraC-like DNA-binding protein